MNQVKDFKLSQTASDVFIKIFVDKTTFDPRSDQPEVIVSSGGHDFVFAAEKSNLLLHLKFGQALVPVTLSSSDDVTDESELGEKQGIPEANSGIQTGSNLVWVERDHSFLAKLQKQTHGETFEGFEDKKKLVYSKDGEGEFGLPENYITLAEENKDLVEEVKN